MSIRIKGVIRGWNSAARWGFIRGEDNNDYFASTRSFRCSQSELVFVGDGTKVEFAPGKKQEEGAHPHAMRIKVFLSSEIKTYPRPNLVEHQAPRSLLQIVLERKLS
jgi:cold shock CspA family protein